MINQKKSVVRLICWLILSQFVSCSPKLYTIPKNEYGLQVIGKGKEYKRTVQTDTSKRMVALKAYIPDLKTSFYYATDSNFTGQRLYKKPEAYLRVPAARALRLVQDDLQRQGFSIKVFDAYRPYKVTKQMWKVVPDDRYAANPAQGSGHNRGTAVDLTLTDLAGTEVEMPTKFDDFTEKAHHNYTGISATAAKNRTVLKETMEKYGFLALDTEWWHY